VYLENPLKPTSLIPDICTEFRSRQKSYLTCISRRWTSLAGIFRRSILRGGSLARSAGASAAPVPVGGGPPPQSLTVAPPILPMGTWALGSPWMRPARRGCSVLREPVECTAALAAGWRSMPTCPSCRQCGPGRYDGGHDHHPATHQDRPLQHPRVRRSRPRRRCGGG
jgi:hypothetical protein